jgi:flagellin-like protein
MGMGIYHNHQSQKGGIKEKMNTIRKIKHDVKALSPVVASIILIAVTVAVSIAVAAWMGALVVGQMATEELKITNCDFTATDIVLSVKNSGTSSVTIDAVYVDGVSLDFTLAGGTSTVDANSQDTITVTPTVAPISGNSYSMKIVTTKGNYYTYTAIAP